MSLIPGSRLGPFEVTAQIGEGGMGQVYRARDTKLNRNVALKVLPDSFANDADRLARFTREAQTLAALNHPNIAHIHGLEESNGVRALVMELIEGEDLSQRILRGAITLDEALPIAKQIAEALEAAHEQGIIHRDLKPANIKLRPDGTVKVLDFGLAKAMETVRPAANLSQSPTITTPAMTQAGLILGTAAYMSPEQARGRAVDKRSDIWAFGCVLYEMLTGTRAFGGAEVSDTLVAVLTSEPDWGALPPAVPSSVRTLLRRCLTKDRTRRLDSAADARLEIDDAMTSPVPEAPIHAAVRGRRAPLWRTAVAAGAVVVVGLGAGYVGWRLRPAAPRAVTRFAITLAAGDGLNNGGNRHLLALSPDGTRVAYAANNRLYLQSLDQLDAVAATAAGSTFRAARSPSFSPDGRWVVFWEEGQLKKVSVTGGAPVTVSAAEEFSPFGTTWAADNTILIGRGSAGIWRVSGNGGTPEPVIAVDAGQRAHGPQLLPDGRTVLFTLARSANWNDAEIVVQSLDGGARRTLITGGTDGRYLPTGHLVYARAGTVLAVSFDPTSLKISGATVPLLEGLWQNPSARGLTGTAHFAMSSEGTFAYISSAGVTAVRRTLVWVDRQGREEAIAAPPRAYIYARLAPDSTRLALDIQDDDQDRNIWLLELPRGPLTRLTFEPTADRQPVWTPNGQRLIFSSDRNGLANLFWQAANGTGTAEPLIPSNNRSMFAQTMSPDGKRLVVREIADENVNLTILDVGDGSLAAPPSSHQLNPLVQTSFTEENAEISPNGQWLAYQSNRSGAVEVYVQPFPDVAGSLRLVSTGGGTEPLWSRDGQELFYRAATGAVMRVSIAAGSTWSAGTPTQLIEARPYALGTYRTYDVSPDAKRFLMIKQPEAPAQASTAPRIVVVQNWTEDLKRRGPSN